MPDYRRLRTAGATYFFTVNLLNRHRPLLTTHIDHLRTAVRRVRALMPFHIDAWVVLPEHMHALWTLPENNSDFPRRCQAIKMAFSKSIPPRRSPIPKPHHPRQARHPATPLSATPNPRRPRRCRAHG